MAGLDHNPFGDPNPVSNPFSDPSVAQAAGRTQPTNSALEGYNPFAEGGRPATANVRSFVRDDDSL